MTTALEIIKSAMQKVGIIAATETPEGDDAELGRDRLNDMIDSWENEGIHAYTSVTTVFTLPANTTSRTIGPSMQIDITRPVKVSRGSFSRIGDKDYELEPISEAEYNSIGVKSFVSTAPSQVWFDGGSPTGIVYFWPAPASSVEVHLVTPTPGGRAVDLTTDFDLPPGYLKAMIDNLAIELAPYFEITPSQFLIGSAINSKRLLKRTNYRVPQLDIPHTRDRRGNSPSDFTSGY